MESSQRLYSLYLNVLNHFSLRVYTKSSDIAQKVTDGKYEIPANCGYTNVGVHFK